MAPPRDSEEGKPPDIIHTSPTFGSKSNPRKLFKLNSKDDEENKSLPSLRWRNIGPLGEEHSLRVQRTPAKDGQHMSASSSTYMGSYKHSPHQSRTSLSGLAQTREGSVTPSPRVSLSQTQVKKLLQNPNIELDTYGVEEYRDGFFDAIFLKPSTIDQEELLKLAENTLPAALLKRHPLSLIHFFPEQWHGFKGAIFRITRTRVGLRLTKSFLAFFIAYALCLASVTGDWLGKYREIIVLSVIINHPGRTVGAQIDGTILSILGTASGLGWGALALYLSDLSSVVANGYGGVLATFLVIFMGTAAALRSYFIRLYQLVLPAGISIIYTCLADTSQTVAWSKLLSYGIPWVLGQAICLFVCCIIFPDAGSRPLAEALHDAFATMQDGLIYPRTNVLTLHQQLAWTFVNLSQAYRDLALDISVTRFHPADIASLRNLMQAIVRSLLTFKSQTNLFEDYEVAHPPGNEYDQTQTNNMTMGRESNSEVIDMESHPLERALGSEPDDERAVKLVVMKMADPVKELLSCMRFGLSTCNAVLLDMSGYRKYLGPPANVPSDTVGGLTRLRKAMLDFDEENDILMESPQLPATYSDHPELVKYCLFMNPIRQAANTIEDLLVAVMKMQQQEKGWQIYLPSFWSLQRTNAQVRHDRGGVTAGFFFHSQKQLNQLMSDLQKGTYQPYAPEDDVVSGKSHLEEYKEEEKVIMDRDTAGKETLRYQLWSILHGLQGFETRFALKVAIVISLLSVPAWLGQSSQWYSRYQLWWAVVTAWLMMHPRVGGSFQDLVTRALCGVIGALWGGLAYAAGHGNPYVMAVFAVIYMIPFLYRFTRSSHPRSGLIGCISFTVVSLNAYTRQDLSIVTLSWSLGLAFVVGVVSAIVVNWILWPFVARHELRKSISAMLFHSAIIYRGVVSKYIYYEDGQAPRKEDIARSEELESKLREGFVRIRQLMALTQHEIRLRGPFDPLPFSALVENCELFFEDLIEVRQASLFFHPNYMSENINASEALLPFRRDAVASILMTLYILAGALRGNRKVPRYLPSAAAARKKLLDRMAEVEIETAQERMAKVTVPKKLNGRKFAEVYQFAYSQALTKCVERLGAMQNYTKIICGEEGFDPVDENDSDVTKPMVATGFPGSTSH